MVHPGLLRIQLETGGAWRIQLGDGDSRPAEARLGPEPAASLLAAARAELRAPPVVIEDGDDVARTRREMRAGQILGAVLAAPGIAARMGELLTQARLCDGRLALAVDAEGPEIQALPWELLATGPDGHPLEASGGMVVRLAFAPSLVGASALGAPPRGGRLRVLLGCPTPTDPDCAAVVASLYALFERLGLDPPVSVDPLEEGRLPPALPDQVDVLHYVCHGDFLHEAFVLQSGVRPHLPGVLVGQVGDDLGRLPLVVLDVCGAGDPGQALLIGLVAQMLQGAAQSAVAPARAAHVAASQAFSLGLYRALGLGASVVRAVAEGRNQVRTLAHPHPSARASNILFSVSRLSTLRAPPPLDQTWAPEGWARPDAELRALLGRARQLALEDENGHVGIEHLVRAARPGEGGPLSARMRSLRGQISDSDWRAIAAVSMPDQGRCLTTPRVARLLRGAAEGAGVEQLWRALALDPDHGLHALVGLALETLVLAPTRGGPTPVAPFDPLSRPPATALQQLWGPLDGRVLAPSPGQTLGRLSAHDGPDLAIYPAEIPYEDPLLSRRHIQWIGPGQCRALRPLRHVRFGVFWKDAPEIVGETLTLQTGDLLILTRRTWLRGVAALGPVIRNSR